MVRGGAAETTELTEREREICERIGPALKRRGLILVGIDVIDDYLTEINVTSPTGMRAIKRLGGPDLAVPFWDAIEDKVPRACTSTVAPTPGGAAVRRRRFTTTPSCGLVLRVWNTTQ